MKTLPVGMAIRSVRRHRGIAAAEVSRKLGVFRTMIAKIESGKRPVRVHELVAIAEAMGVSPTKLLKYCIHLGEAKQ